ncbi:MAG: hypothetical protein ABI972_03630 [Acidobacteriota bacterium]
MTEHLLRQYRLGRLSEAERHEIERRAFEDDAFEDRLLEAEADLLDDWARGTLTEEDRAAVESLFPKEQLAVARAIQREAGTAGVVPVAQGATRATGVPVTQAGPVVPVAPAERRSANMWPGWAVAAALLIGLMPALYLWQRGPRIERVEVQGAAQDEVATLALHVPTTRGASAPKVRVARTAQWVRMTMDADGGYEFYEVRVESARSGLVFAQTIRSGPPVTLTIPAGLLAAGEYDFVVSGRKGGETTLLATYVCGVEK